MKEIIYDKLIRDKFPEIIEKSVKQCEIEILSDLIIAKCILDLIKVRYPDI